MRTKGEPDTVRKRQKGILIMRTGMETDTVRTGGKLDTARNKRSLI